MSKINIIRVRLNVMLGHDESLDSTVGCTNVDPIVIVSSETVSLRSLIGPTGSIALPSKSLKHIVRLHAITGSHPE